MFGQREPTITEATALGEVGTVSVQLVMFFPAPRLRF